jgi:hypothetical protein
MKQFVILSLLLLSAAPASAQTEFQADTQTEFQADTLRGLPSHYRDYDGFLLDLNLLDLKPASASSLLTLPRLTAAYPYTTSLLGDHPFSPSSPQLRLIPERPKGSWSLRTFSTHNLDGWHTPGGGLPWQRNNVYRGTFELRSPDGKFSFRVETRQYR